MHVLTVMTDYVACVSVTPKVFFSQKWKLCHIFIITYFSKPCCISVFCGRQTTLDPIETN